jgi:hypothetical protein
MVIHSDASEANGFDASKTPTFYSQPLPFDPTAAFHEYRIDWEPNLAKFYVDSVLVHTMNENIPTEPGTLFLNHWSNGSPGWSWGPPTEMASMTVLYVKAYFNSSDPSRVNSAQNRCSAATAGKPLTCAIPDEMRTPGGKLPSAAGPAPASYPTTNVGLDASGTGMPVAVPTSQLPARGDVPFMGSVPGNVVGQVAYNVTFDCDGCPKTPNGNAPRTMSADNGFWVILYGLMVVWVL